MLGDVSQRSDERVSTPLREGDRRVWQRHAGDVARLVWRGALLLFLLAITAVVPSALRNASESFVSLFLLIPDPIRFALIGIAQLAVIALPLMTLTWLLMRRTRAEAALVVGAGIAGGVVMVLLTDWLDRAAPPNQIEGISSASFISTGFPSAVLLAALVAGAAAASPLMTTAWRHVAWVGVGTAVVTRLLTATQAPVNIAVTVALGGVVGSAVLVLIGSPVRRPGAASLRSALSDAGFEVDDLRDEESHTGRRTFLGTASGRDVRIVFLDRDDRDAALLAKFLRFVRVYSVDEDSLSVNPDRRVEHEALVTLLAQQADARVPTVYAIASSEGESAVIALEVPRGTSLSEFSDDSDLPASSVDDDGLDDLWRQLETMHEARIAHRALTSENLYLDGSTATLTGLENARLVATDDQCSVDIAEILISTSLVVGADRAIASAARVVSRAELQNALAFVQPAALPSATRRAARRPKGFIDDTRAELVDTLGLEDVELAPLERISIAKVVTWIGFGVLAFFLLTLVSSWSEISEAMKGIDWNWVLPIFIATIFGTFGGALSLSGSVVRRIPLGEATVVMFGQSFLNRFTPMNAGGMAMRIRYLQKGGTDITVATAAIGLTSAASGVVQVMFIAFFFLWSSSDPASGIDTDGGGGGVAGSIVVVIIIAVLVAAVTIAFTPKFRRWLVAFVRSTAGKVRQDFGELARRPSKLAALFGGAALGKFSTIVAFVFSCRAFDIDIAFAELGAMYLVATTIASTVPTPGGVGAVEAALVLVLTNAGVPDATAWAAVLLFRLINYWFPTIPGYAALKISERRELV
jgi:uncharacterized membrane protein YbhN (UPF0104 family)/tRNA A-37 threonylcarbamoyl transferase component Bud32